MDVQQHERKVAEELFDLSGRGPLNFDALWRQPARKLKSIHKELEILAGQGFSITFIHAVLNHSGLICHENTLRRYIQKNLPEIHSRHYAKNKIIAHKNDMENSSKKETLKKDKNR